MSGILNEMSSDTFSTNEEKLGLYDKLNDLNALLVIIFDSIEGDSEAPAYKKSIYLVSSQLTDVWRTILFNSYEKEVYFTEVEDAYQISAAELE